MKDITSSLNKLKCWPMSQLLNLTLLEFKRQSSKLYFFGLGFDSRLKSQMFLPAAIVDLMSSRTFTAFDSLLEPTVSRQTLQPREWIYQHRQHRQHRHHRHAKWRRLYKGFSPFQPYPTSSGWKKRPMELLQKLPEGGGCIKNVTLESSTPWNP